MLHKIRNFRLHFLFAIILIAFVCVFARLFSLQIVRHNFYTALARGQHEVLQKLIPRRGEIFIQEKGNIWHPLATNRDYQTVFLAPNKVLDKNEVAEKLSSLLDIPQEKILDKLKDPDDPYEPLKSKLDDEAAEKIKSLNLAGVHLISESWRWYPQGALASSVLGFVGIGGNEKIGQYGLEQYYQKELEGTNGFLKSERDAAGRWLLLGDYDLQPADNGSALYLTLDQNIQYVVEQKFKAVLEKWGASGGCAIVLEPKTGALKAMASFPDFDPNEYQKVKEPDNFMNSCTQKLYEPGSVFKPVVMAAGLDTGKISPETTYTDTGSVQIGGYTIKNAQEKVYGLSTMTKVLEKSINTGAIYVERLIGGETFRNYIEAFGFDEVCGIDLAGEVRGNLINIRENREINFATATFGQGISMTALQMVSAIGAIANDGKLMQPHLVAKIVAANGEEKQIESRVIRQVISSQTASQLTAMLVSTVRNGYDKIKIKGYFIAGKTGTAQIPNQDKRGYSEETVHSFVGYAPAYNPQFLIFLKMDKPRGIQFASESLAPVFADLAQYLFNYYEIPPEE